MIDRPSRSAAFSSNEGKRPEDRIFRIYAVRQQVGPQRLAGDLLHAFPLLARSLSQQSVLIIGHGGLNQPHAPWNMEHDLYHPWEPWTLPRRTDYVPGRFGRPCGGTEVGYGPAGTRSMISSPGCAALSSEVRQGFTAACVPRKVQMVEISLYAVGRGRNATKTTSSPTTRYNPR